jgi:signal transduction histidine kinase
VKDTGPGISEEDKPKLFQKFSRIYSEQNKDVSGTGLGLWITKQLVEKMGGKIYVESIENEGSQFIVSFPLKEAFLMQQPTNQ